jgi:tetratricopeptide (TPR) repeat protein
VGKTSLAVRWAHRTVGRFPDGQLYVNLRGFGPSGAPATPLEAIRGFLSALQIPPERIPVDPDAQAGLYRSMLAGKRMLIVADNAHDESQVRPLLPADPSCMVLVTSRRQLAGLVTAEGAHPLTLDLLSQAEAHNLLAHRLGRPRLVTQPRAVDDIVARCARLPLALAIVAARAAAHPDFPLAALAAELQRTGGSLDVFRGEDAATDLGAVFAWSYRMLRSDTARLFRLLAVHPGPDVTAGAAASLTATVLPRARAQLAELARAHLITEYAPGRYTVHDLLRTYAGELIESYDSRAEHDAAVHRVFDHYLHTARAAALLREPDREPIVLATACPEVTVEPLADSGEALAWFTAEHPVLLAVIREAGRAGYDNHTWQLAWTLKSYLQRQGHWHDWVATQQAALDATQRLDNPAGQAIAHRLLGGAHARLGHDDDAQAHLRQAIDLYAHLDDKDGQARTRLSLALALESRGQYQQALDHARDALALHRMTGHLGGQARALNAIGWTRALLGDYPQALTSCQEALALIRGTGDGTGEAAVWDSLGYVHRHLGHDLRALDCYQHALVLLEEVGDRYLVAVTLTSLGDTHLATGDVRATTEVWRRALDILEDLGHPDAGPLRIRLLEAHDQEARPA